MSDVAETSAEALRLMAFASKKTLQNVIEFINICTDEGYLENLLRFGKTVAALINEEYGAISEKRLMMSRVLATRLYQEGSLLHVTELPPLRMEKSSPLTEIFEDRENEDPEDDDKEEKDDA